MTQPPEVTRFPNHPSSVRAAREFVADALNDSPPQANAARLLVSELATNAVLHSVSSFSVSVSADHEIRVDVEDSRADQLFATDMAAERHGLGLRFLEETARTWGVERRGTTKLVWFSIPRLG